jgi:molecular chaperone GrpE
MIKMWRKQVSQKKVKGEEQIKCKEQSDCVCKEEKAGLAEELAAQKDKYVRLMAEFDNYKKRTANEYAKTVELANKNLIDDLIEVREVFEKALDENSKQDDMAAFREGILLLSAKFNEILTKHGLEAFGEIGDDFDPALHDAMMKQPCDKTEVNKIMTIYQRGYKLKNNIIRHAKVIVSAGKQEN